MCDPNMEKGFLDHEDMTSSFLYGLGFTIINLIEKEAAVNISKNLWNKEFERVNETFQDLIRKKPLLAPAIFLISSVLTTDRFQRPSPPLLEIFSNLILRIQVRH